MINLIVATDRNGGIGRDNRLLWHLPEDLRFFKKKTLGEVVIMGRKTFHSIGKPLPQRTNIILTRQEKIDTGDQRCIIAHTFEDALNLAKMLHQEVFVIGGAEIYELFLPHAENIYLTYINEEFHADTFFPEWDKEKFSLLSETKGKKDEKNPYDYYFRKYKKKTTD